MISDNGYLYFFSTVAQLFSALIGILGLVYSFKANEVRKQIEAHISNFYELIEELIKSNPKSKELMQDSVINVDNLDSFIKATIEPLSESYANKAFHLSTDLKLLKSSIKRQDKKFKEVALISFLIIILSCVLTPFESVIVGSLRIGLVSFVLVASTYCLMQILFYFSGISKTAIAFHKNISDS